MNSKRLRRAANLFRARNGTTAFARTSDIPLGESYRRALRPFETFPAAAELVAVSGSPSPQLDERQDDVAVALAGPVYGPHKLDHGRPDLDEALAPIALHRPPSTHPRGLQHLANRHALDGQRTPKVSKASRALIPPRIAIATLLSSDALARAAATASPSTSEGMTSTPSRSPKMRSPGAIRTPSISIGVRNRSLCRAGLGLARTVRAKKWESRAPRSLPHPERSH